MDPISLAIGAVGLGMQIFGGIGASQNAKEAAAINQDVAKQEQSINERKMTQMAIESRRMQLENIRNNQRARALSEATAVNQGAQFGSGLQGGQAQINDQTLFNMQGVNQAIQTGSQIYGLNSIISEDKQKLASVQSDMATNQGIASLGGSVMKAGPIIGQLSQGFGGFSFNSLFGGGSPSGYGK
jgi:hypothetical protein